MRICIPTTSDAGARGRLSPHFGTAPYLTLVDVEAAHAEAIPNPSAGHRQGRCDVAAAIAERGTEVVVCREMGQGGLDALRALGVQVLRTEAWTVADAVRDFRNRALVPLTVAHAGHHAG